MMSMAHSQEANIGLSHLVEAATALTKLVDVASPTEKAIAAQVQQSVVSDDDSSSRKSLLPQVPKRSFLNV